MGFGTLAAPLEPVQGRTRTIGESGPPHAILKEIIHCSNGHYFLAAGNRNEYNHRSWHIGYILHGQDKGASSTKLTWERVLNIWKTFKTFIELRIMHTFFPSNMCVQLLWFHYFQHVLLFNSCLFVFFFICHSLSIHLSTYKWLICLYWSWRKVTFVGKGSLM